MSKRYTRRPHKSIGLFTVDASFISLPNTTWWTTRSGTPHYAPMQVWAVCQDHAFHLIKSSLTGYNGGRLKMKDVVCVDSVAMDEQMPYKQARDMCLLFNQLAKEKEEGR